MNTCRQLVIPAIHPFAMKRTFADAVYRVKLYPSQVSIYDLGCQSEADLVSFHIAFTSISHHLESLSLPHTTSIPLVTSPILTLNLIRIYFFHNAVTEKHTTVVVRGKRYWVGLSDMQGWRISECSSTHDVAHWWRTHIPTVMPSLG